MKGDRRSRTAERVAIRRAAHQLVDDPLVFVDPVAIPIIGKENEAQLRADLAGESGGLQKALRTFMAVRSRVSEDTLAESLSRGVAQYVILGAGLDTFAYRNPYVAKGLRVFEVDYPGTQAWKRERLAEAGIEVPPSLTFAPVDFETETLPDGLRTAGWRPEQPTFFSWLGVTQYLTQEAIDATLGFIASTPFGGGVVFDYSISPELLTLVQRGFYYLMAARVASIGEPWLSTFDPAKLLQHLKGLGFGEVEDLTPECLNARYLANRTDGLQVGGLAHLMRGWTSEMNGER